MVVGLPGIGVEQEPTPKMSEVHLFRQNQRLELPKIGGFLGRCFSFESGVFSASTLSVCRGVR